MKKTTALAIFLSAVIFAAGILSGCDFRIKSSENLIRPPRISGENGALELAFEDAVQDMGEKILRYPASGTYRSAYVRYDCDGDGMDEAFVFYSPAIDEMSVYMYMLDFRDGAWHPVINIPGDGSNIYSIEFYDLDGDGTSELLVGWSNFDSKSSNTLTVYCPEINEEGILSYKAAAIESFSCMLPVNVDDDDVTELIIALIDKASESDGAGLVALELGKNNGSSAMSIQAKTSLYPGVTSVNKISADLSEGKTRLFVDEAADGSYFTEVFYCDPDEKTLEPVFEINAQSFSVCPTLRTTTPYCADVNRDGLFEIPVSATMDGCFIYSTQESVSGEASAEDSIIGNVSLTSWCTLQDDGMLEPISSSVINSYDGFSLNWDEDILKWSTINIYPDRGMTEILDSDGNVLFSIVAVDAVDAGKTDGLLAVTATTAYVSHITDDGVEYGIQDKLITKIFSLF
ncbi:MAG: VCBS repeat-containing protein [Clostridia bacterium]|nr:VCBS repeat-containing protein [Clostridia bacterium]